MASVIRSIAGGVAGIAVAVGTVAAFELLGRTVGALRPPPVSRAPEALSAYFQGLPVSALLFVALGWFVAVLLGSYAAVLISRSRPVLFSLLVGGVILLAAVANFALLPHPVWFVAVGIAAVALATLFAAKITGRATDGSSKSTPRRGRA